LKLSIINYQQSIINFWEIVLAQQTQTSIGGARSFVCLREHFVFWPFVILGLAFDLWSKKAVFDWLGNTYPPVYPVISGFLRLVAQENSGAAFGIAQGQKILLLIVSLAAIVVVIYFFLFGRDRRTLLTVALALFLAGILGNAYDRIFNNGMVRDFIDVHYKDWHWPAFNVADSLLCIGVFLLLLAGVVKSRQRS
jgi:signal peptidase II